MSRYDLFRRRIAPIAFGLAIVLIARDACNKEQRTHATIVFDVGSDNHADGLDAELFTDGAFIATFHHAAFTGRVQFDASLPAEDGELHIDLDVGGKLKKTVRHFHAVESSTVTIPLAELVAAP